VGRRPRHDLVERSTACALPGIHVRGRLIALLRRDRRERHPDRRRDGGQPDLLPITAVAVGALFALAQDALDLIPSGFNVHEVGVLGSLTSVNDGTIAVALAAGVAGMLALETRAS
jgi:hypothetical protein